MLIHFITKWHCLTFGSSTRVEEMKQEDEKRVRTRAGIKEERSKGQMKNFSPDCLKRPS